MTQRFALIIASALTAFVLVLMLGVGLTVGARSVVEAQAATPVTAIQVAEQLVVPAPAAVKPQLSADQAAQTRDETRTRCTTDTARRSWSICKARSLTKLC